MGFDLKNIRKFDNDLKTIDERREYVEKLFDENVDMMDEYAHGAMLANGSLCENMPVNITIEEWGTYLLRSSDVESTRAGDHSFFETEKRYRQYAIGKSSIATDMASNDEFVNYTGEDGVPAVYDKYKLFNFDEMTPEQKKKLIKTGLAQKDNKDCGIRKDLQSAYEYIMDLLTDEKDMDIVDMLIDGKTESEIAKEIGIAQQNVNKRIDRICNKKL